MIARLIARYRDRRQRLLGRRGQQQHAASCSSPPLSNKFPGHMSGKPYGELPKVSDRPAVGATKRR